MFRFDLIGYRLISRSDQSIDGQMDGRTDRQANRQIVWPMGPEASLLPPLDFPEASEGGDVASLDPTGNSLAETKNRPRIMIDID